MPFDVVGFDTDTQAPPSGTPVRPPGGRRSFDVLEDAVTFVMEEVPLESRPTVMIRSDAGLDMDIDAVEAHYRAMRNTI